MPLTLRQIEDVCLEGEGAQQCRYLGEDSSFKFYCMKKTAVRDDIDAEVSDFVLRTKAKGVDPDILGHPIGDNCKGYTLFRHLTQGYDVPN